MIAVCRADALAEGEAVRVQADVPVAVFRSGGALYAVDDTCTHQDASLTDGYLEGCFVECPLHASIFDLRTVDDAVALRDDLARAGSLVVVGGGFIGAEVASSARSLGLDVTVVEALGTPLSGPLGPQLGGVCAALHADHGVRLLTGTAVARLVGDDRVTAVELADGTTLPADVVVIGVGAQPHVEWLAGSGLELDGGVVTDASCATNVPGVVAVGDCASSYDPVLGRHRRIEHWTHALHQPATAAATVLGGGTAYTAVPYFWSEQYGRQLQLAGSHRPGDVVTVVEGSTDSRSFVATYERDGRLVAVLALDAGGAFARWRRILRTQLAALTAALPAS